MNGTVIYFDYGGYYSDDGNDVQWNRKESHVYSILHKGSIEDVTYSWLVGRICKKINVDEAATKMKISYIPMQMDPIRQSYIFDDEDVTGYLMQISNVQCRSVLHVEVTENDSVNQNLEQPVIQNWEHNWEQNWEQPVVSLNSGWEPWERYEHVDINPYISNGEESRVDEDGSRPRDEDCSRPHDDDVPRDEDGTRPRDDDVPRDEDDTHDDSHVNNSSGPEWEDGLNLRLGQEFRTKQEVMDLVERAIHLNCFDVNTIKSTTTLYVVKCRGSNCTWALRVAKLKNSDFFSVRTYTKMHTCSRTSTSTRRGKRKGTQRLVASIVHEDYPGRFDTPTPKNLITMVQGRMGVKVSYSTAWRGKRQAANDVRGSPEESYMFLPSYFYMLEQMNPGSVTRVELDEQNRFRYAFVALGACIEGFQVMRKVIVVDGTHLKGLYGGVLIIASCQDPEKHHYPIAFGVVDGEKDDSWRWFLMMLQKIIPDDPELVFLSDRNQSIIKTIGEVYPKSHHGFCTWHLSQNVKSRVYGVKKEDVASKFMECASAYSESEFISLYGAFRKKYPKAASYLDESVDVRQWARCYFPGERYNICTTNLVESMNGVFKKARKLSIIPMFDEILAKIGEWFNKHRKETIGVCSTQMLVPRVEGLLHKEFPVAKLLSVTELNSFLLEYNVLDRDGKWYLVNLREKTCGCKRFDINKYPCVHALAAIMEYAKTEVIQDIHTHDYCSNYFRLDFWITAYRRTIYPVPDKSDWNVPDDIKKIVPIPPPCIVKKGRRQERRFPSVGESRPKKN